MNSLSVLGKYLDQPRLVGRFSQAVPAILVAGGGIYTYKHVKNTPKEDKQKELTKSIIVIGTTIAAALIAPKIALKVTKSFSKSHKSPHVHTHECTHGHHHHEHEHEHGEKIDLKELKEETTELVDEFLQKNKVSTKTAQLLSKAKEKILRPSEIKTVFEELKEKKNGKEFLSKLVPDPENIDSGHIFGEIGRISILGLIPVLGGIAGGMIADKTTEKDWKDRIPNKIKEGAYQYLANIFLCNIGAGVALWTLEKAKIQSKAARAIAMIGGIVLAGIVFGSAIANLVGKKVVDPLLHSKKDKTQNLYSERKPELLDISLHVDDVATVAVLSGLKWIEPALPILYSISGYRAGIGYRNGEDKKRGGVEA